MSILFASVNSFRDVSRGYPKIEYALGTGPGGGDGMTFDTGAEIFTWNSDSVPNGVKPRRIVSLWIDCSAITAGAINISIGRQNFVFTGAAGGGPQGFVVCTANAPINIRVSSVGATGLVNITAYNYNANYTGTTAEAALPATPAGSSSGQTAYAPQSTLRHKPPLEK